MHGEIRLATWHVASGPPTSGALESLSVIANGEVNYGLWGQDGRISKLLALQ